MASVSTDREGRRRVLWVAPDGSRKCVRLGACSDRAAEVFASRVEGLIAAQLTHEVPRDLAAWVRDLPDRMHGALARAGLLTPREHHNPTLGKLLDAYFATLNVKPGTLIAYGQARESLLEHFGADRRLADISTLEVEKWRQSMVDEGLAVATVAKRIRTAKMIFKRAIRWGMMPTNPTEGVRTGSQRNPARAVFVPREAIERILAECPDPEWRAIIALSRYGALRTPSETLALRWADIDWARLRMTVRSSKTEEHEDGGVRVVPIFPELLPHLQAAFDAAEVGAEHVIAKARDPRVNWRTQFRRMIARASLTPWPRLFHGMRASRCTELAAEYPAAVAAAWCGHTVEIATAHYVTVREADYTRATKAAQNPAQNGRESTRTGTTGVEGEPSEVSPVQGDAQLCASVPANRMGPAGFEPAHYKL